MSRHVVVNGRELSMNDAGFIDPNSEWSVTVGEDGSVEVNRLDLKVENEKLREQGERLFDKTLELGTENAKLRELVADMHKCISHANEQDWFYFERDKFGCGMSCTVNGETCGLCTLADRMRELGIEASE